MSIELTPTLMRDIWATVDSCIQQYYATTRPMHFAWVEPSNTMPQRLSNSGFCSPMIQGFTYT